MKIFWRARKRGPGVDVIGNDGGGEGDCELRGAIDGIFEGKYLMRCLWKETRYGLTFVYNSRHRLISVELAETLAAGDPMRGRGTIVLLHILIEVINLEL